MRLRDLLQHIDGATTVTVLADGVEIDEEREWPRVAMCIRTLWVREGGQYRRYYEIDTRCLGERL